ncbi:MAG: ABC transporter permease [Chloroflexi bacterium]|nr:ABC transporter permease [Chloroflexota bacterium]
MVPFRSLIRMSAFWRKEILTIARQPRLIFALVLGPFLILLLFGIGLRIEPRAMRTLFVAPENSPTAAEIQKFATSLGPQLVFTGITSDLEAAKRRLQRNEVDVVVVAPNNPSQTIENSQQAVFTLYHREIDPTEINYVELFGQVYIGEVNRRVLGTEIHQVQTHAGKYQETIRLAHGEATALRQAMQSGNASGAKQNRQNLDRNINSLVTDLAGAVLFGIPTTGNSNNPSGDTLESTMARIQQNNSSLQASDSASANASDIEKVTQIENDLAKLSTQIDQLKKVDPTVAVSPFRSEVKSVSVELNPADFFAPSALALVLQHLALTFAALSIVQEQRMGTMELFRVSPLSTVETLLGKYLSFLFFIAIIGALLSLLIVFGLQVPMLGSWTNYAIVVVLLVFTALGLGFVISLVSQTDSQAIQYAMLTLLASVFFSGAFLSLETLIMPVRLFSWLLPATYGINLLQDVMLRGNAPNIVLIAVLAGIGLLLYFIAWRLLYQKMATR